MMVFQEVDRHSELDVLVLLPGALVVFAKYFAPICWPYVVLQWLRKFVKRDVL